MSSSTNHPQNIVVIGAGTDLELLHVGYTVTVD